LIPYSFTHKHVFKKIMIVAAGPFFNLLLAVIIYTGFFIFIGTEDIRPVVNHVVAESPADRSGTSARGRVAAVNGETVASWGDINRLIAEGRAATCASRSIVTAIFSMSPSPPRPRWPRIY
jgi:regulator of sigma E protease